MKHYFQPTEGFRGDVRSFAQCSISDHIVTVAKTGKPMLFDTDEAVEKFSRAHTGQKLSASLFKACAHALLLRHGAVLAREVPSYAGLQKEFTFQTICGPAEVVPVEDWVIFRFLEPEGKHFPWPMHSKSGLWNIHFNNMGRSYLLLQLEEKLLMSKPAPEAKAPTPLRKVQPPCVMKSQAGFYVGCCVRTDEGDYPHSRFSSYFTKSEDAAKWLEQSQSSCSL
jgi:hypothetical protein